jgi:CRP-like cAMP-binding protein
MSIIDTLHEIGETKVFNKGRIIFNEGDQGDCMYIVLKGEVSIFIDYNLVKKCQPGDFLGEMSLLEHHPRSATAKAETDVVMLRVDANNIENLIAKHPAIAFRMLKSLSQRISALNEQVYRHQSNH